MIFCTARNTSCSIDLIGSCWTCFSFSTFLQAITTIYTLEFEMIFKRITVANRFLVLGLLSFSCIASSPVFGTPLPIGSAILSTPGAGPVGGTVLANTGPLPFNSVPPAFQGTLTSEVIVNDPANPFGAGNLTFTYLLSVTNGGAIHRLTVPGYGLTGILTDATYQAPVAPGSIIPTSFDRSSDPLGDVIGTSFTAAPLGLGDIPPGSSSALIVIQTNSQVFDSSIASVIDGATGQVATFSPRVVVPEPSTLALLGLSSLGLLVRRKFA